MTSLLACVLVASGMVAAALDDHASFAEGRRLYEASEYEQATFRFQEAALDASIVDAGEKAQVFMWLGLAYAGFGDMESARRAFRDALRLDERAALPIEISPKVEAEIDAVRAELRAAREAAAEEERERKRKADDAQRKEAAAPAEAAASTSWVLPAAVGVAGAACVIGGVVAAGLAVASHDAATNLDTFQDEVPSLVATRDTQAAVAVGLIGLGVVLAGGAVFFALE